MDTRRTVPRELSVNADAPGPDVTEDGDARRYVTAPFDPASPDADFERRLLRLGHDHEPGPDACRSDNDRPVESHLGWWWPSGQWCGLALGACSASISRVLHGATKHCRGHVLRFSEHRTREAWIAANKAPLLDEHVLEAKRTRRRETQREQQRQRRAKKRAARAVHQPPLDPRDDAGQLAGGGVGLKGAA